MSDGPERVVTLHGVWMTGLVTAVMCRRLRAVHGFQAYSFRYPSVRHGLEANARRLRGFVRSLDAPVVHLVGHSLGGLVILRMLSEWSDLPPGRVVCLGSPLAGSRVASGLARTAAGRVFVGRSIRGAVVERSAVEWAAVPEGRGFGVIAGTGGVGLGRVLGDLEVPHDGMVEVLETRHPGALEHLVLPVTHTGMLFSREVCDQVAAFLREGHFRSSG